MTPIPITFHSVNSLGGVAETSPTHPEVIGLEGSGSALFGYSGGAVGATIVVSMLAVENGNVRVDE